MTSGVLVVDKAAGCTSFDVVALVRKVLRIRRVGHAGTLDPGAVGVLPILIGEATKLAPHLTGQDKEYVATIRFGLTTDTQDLTGRVLAEATVPPLTRGDLVQATRAFVGRIRQIPPMYSAVHYEGRRLYELAREGREVTREPREVVVHAITVEAVSPPTATLRIVCGKGTYVRTLASDLGAALGCGAAVERLVRSRVGPFRLSDALPSGELATLPDTTVWARVLPPESALAGWPRVNLDSRAASAFIHGQTVEAPGEGPGLERFVGVHGAEGQFLGVGELLAGGRWVKPARILHADRSEPRVLPA
ncbi:MAG: tRNA pseudouridine(55) synthase TruB [Candidatus Rokubacteria bacterium]|nr:tRNA pseudouridine(55) synthase TruB [Candidatus Rokubacteria bacterium]